jgi:hypothetical protein
LREWAEFNCIRNSNYSNNNNKLFDGYLKIIFIVQLLINIIAFKEKKKSSAVFFYFNKTHFISSKITLLPVKIINKIIDLIAYYFFNN